MRPIRRHTHVSTQKRDLPEDHRRNAPRASFIRSSLVPECRSRVFPAKSVTSARATCDLSENWNATTPQPPKSLETQSTHHVSAMPKIRTSLNPNASQSKKDRNDAVIPMESLPWNQPENLRWRICALPSVRNHPAVNE